jgi:hypothetical protein
MLLSTLPLAAQEPNVFDCNKDVLAFHDEEVTLTQSLRTQMRDHRNANRKRLKDRLKEKGHPQPSEFIKQGSYAMLTMVQDPDNDYDIDDGVYFAEADLKDSAGAPLSPKATRERICDALQDDRFNKQPKVLKSCVRVYYNEGYHVDLPVYRIRATDGEYELASGDDWRVSRAADVEQWFYDANAAKSPDLENGRQFRRVTRIAKKFARSRVSWKTDIARGFTVTKLVEECFVSDGQREDVALRETLSAIHRRLQQSLEVGHPTTAGDLLATADDMRTAYLRDRLAIALADLTVLDSADCTSAKARKAWDKAFNTDFFSAREVQKVAEAANAAVLANIISAREYPRPVDKQGGGRFA